jgi:hypothetical protein
MNFRTELHIPNNGLKIEHHDALFFMGSCFAENIAEKTEKLLFNSVTNPHGILYNPYSIVTALYDYCNKNVYSDHELFYYNNWWNSWNHHSRFSNTDKNECLKIINSEIEKAHHHLKKSKFLFITLGSAFVYRKKSSNQLVGNCHKVPNKEFEKELLSINTIIELFEKNIQILSEFNPSLQIIFTVSPVRYIRDGIIENNLSKARLIESVHQLCNRYSNCSYFPAYELVIDDLRDYRFFEEDMVHPNKIAIDYVWKKFSNSYLSNQCLNIIKQIDEINKAENHRPFNSSSDSYQLFVKNNQEKKATLMDKHPYLKFK